MIFAPASIEGYDNSNQQAAWEHMTQPERDTQVLMLLEGMVAEVLEYSDGSPSYLVSRAHDWVAHEKAKRAHLL